MKTRNLINGLLAASLLAGAAACSTSADESFKPGTYATGLVIDGYVAPGNVGFESYPELQGLVMLDVSEAGDITGTLTIEYTPKDVITDGPGEYDITGTASGTTYSFTAGDYTSTGTITSEGTLEGDLTGTGDETGVVFGLNTGTDIIPVCGNTYWNIDSASYSGSDYAIMFGAVYDTDKLWLVSVGQDFVASTQGTITEEINAGFFDPTFTVTGDLTADDLTATSATISSAVKKVVPTKDVSFTATENPESPAMQIDTDNGYFNYLNSGFVNESMGLSGFHYGTSNNCPGIEAPCGAGAVGKCSAYEK